MQDNKNLLVALLLSGLILTGWQYFVVAPEIEAEKARQEMLLQQQSPLLNGEAADTILPQVQGPVSAGAGNLRAGNLRAGNLQKGAGGQPLAVSREEALRQGARVTINTPRIYGSLSLVGGHLDDLVLKEYRDSIEPRSEEVILLAPRATRTPYFASFGWATADQGLALPDENTLWQVAPGATLTPETPVVLTWDNGQGLVFQREISVDEDYLFTITQSVTNKRTQDVTLHPYGYIRRYGKPDTSSLYFLHEGFLGVSEADGLIQSGYDDILENTETLDQSTGGWLGITDKYWAVALIPPQDQSFDGKFSAKTGRQADEIYQADYLLGAHVIPAGSTTRTRSLLFAGAKVVSIIDAYGQNLQIEKFDLLIDWGYLSFFTKPLFSLLHFFAIYTGNFGASILIVTILVKLVFFPLANRSYDAMSKMKKLQPEMERIRDQYKNDKMKQQQALMELYKTEQVNPLAGCLPILIQIPVFFALYNVLLVTIEMRHAPFFGWIRDLSAPDPTTVFNLFGLVPWDPPSLLMIGIWPLLMGLTMFVQQRMNPAPADPVQQQIFTWMPVFFTFLLAGFPAGLVIYWAWNNLLSIAQQGVIMRRNGVKIELFNNLGIARMLGRKERP